jgi:hypothetical protein
MEDPKVLVSLSVIQNVLNVITASTGQIGPAVMAIGQLQQAVQEAGVGQVVPGAEVPVTKPANGKAEARK